MLPEDRTRLAWWALGLGLAAVLGWVLSSFVGTFVFGVFVYYATRPVYRRLKRRIRPRSLAAAVSLLVLALPVILLLAYAIAVGLGEFGRFAARYDLGAIEEYVRPYFDLSTLTLTPAEIASGTDLETVRQVLSSATGYLGFIGNGLLHVFVMIAIAFYLLRDGHRLSRWARRRFADERGVLESYLDAIDRGFHQIFFGNILNAVLTGVIGTIAYGVLTAFAPPAVAIPYPTLVGLLAGVASLIPVVGMKLVYVPVGIYLYAQAVFADGSGLLWFPTAFVLVSFVIVDTIPDFVLRPYVSGRNLHVGMVMFAYILGPLLFGWYGIFLAPMLLVLIVHFVRLVLPELVTGESIQPMAVDPGNLTEVPAEPIDESGSERAGEGSSAIDD